MSWQRAAIRNTERQYSSLAPARRDDLANDVGEVLVAHDDVVHPPRQLHHAERVLEASVGAAGVDQVRERQLVDVAQPLERARVDDSQLVGIGLDEDMDGVANFIELFRHATTVSVMPPHK